MDAGSAVSEGSNAGVLSKPMLLTLSGHLPLDRDLDFTNRGRLPALWPWPPRSARAPR